jgi:3-isopropylmalate/(R)-2-methylmalate dehydratase small subunit
MEPFRHHEGIAAPIDDRNVDTDQIIPGRFLLKPRAFDHGQLLFYDLRRKEGEAQPFVLDLPAYSGASIIVGNDNFGCGSSREQAPFALFDFGIRVVIAPSFGDIFRINCVKNGILPAQVDSEVAGLLRRRLWDRPGNKLAVDLQDLSILESSRRYGFVVDPSLRDQLLSGEDDIARTLKDERQVDAFEDKCRRTMSWAHPTRE